jgi:flavin-binding protein dodecin
MTAARRDGHDERDQSGTHSRRLTADDRAKVRICSRNEKEGFVAESVYKIIELVGTSSESWEKAAAAAVELASKSLRDLRIAEVSQLDLQIEDGKVKAYRAKVNVSFKYEGKE